MSERNKGGIARIGIVPHLGKAELKELVSRVIGWLDERGVGTVLDAEDASAVGRPELGQPEGVFPDADLVVSLGGDGTILRSIRLLAGRSVPVLGINLGTLGFLSVAESGELYNVLEKVLRGEYEVDERMLLDCLIAYSSGERARHLALNEVVVGRAESQRLTQIDVSVNGSLFNKYTADGLILATPTGSTAYSFSAGGPVVSPDNDLIIMTPINTHSLFGRSVVLNPKDKVEIEIPGSIETNVGADGRDLAVSAVIERLTVGRAVEKALLVRADGDFYATFRKKLRVWDFWMEG